MGEETHQSQKTLMKSSAHHHREGVGLVAVYDRGTDYDIDGEWCFEEMGGEGYRLTLGSRSLSQTVGLGMGLLSNLCMKWCWELSTPAHKNTIIFPARNPLPFISDPNINPLPYLVLPLVLSPFLLLLKSFIARRRDLGLPIEDLPITISFQSPIF